MSRTVARRSPNIVTLSDFWESVDQSGDCWIWAGKRYTPNGYGMLATRILGELMAHRVAYVATRGPIPDGLQVDHLCRNRACVRPDHLEAVTAAENVRRAYLHNVATHCKRGHAFSASNTYIRPGDGRRTCLACQRDRRRRRSAREKGRRT